MVRKDASFLRSQRIKEIEKLIAIGITEKKAVNLDQLVNEIQYRIGVLEETAKTYIKILLERHDEWLIDKEVNAIIFREGKHEEMS